MLAVAIYDEDHHQVGDLGQPTAAVAALLPLPLYQCWCYLAQVACRLGEGLVMQQAAHVVVPHFVTTSPDRPLWEESPLDSQTLHRCDLLLINILARRLSTLFLCLRQSASQQCIVASRWHGRLSAAQTTCMSEILPSVCGTTLAPAESLCPCLLQSSC